RAKAASPSPFRPAPNCNCPTQRSTRRKSLSDRDHLTANRETCRPESLRPTAFTAPVVRMSMRKVLSLFPSRKNRKQFRRKPSMESLEHRVPHAGNLLVTTSVGTTYPVQQVLREYSPNGVQLRQINIASGDEARDVTVSDNGDIHVYYGTFGPVLDTY